MKVAFHLAKLAKGRTSPNPPVGAVLVKSGEIIGKGYTQSPGESHAETVALNQADARAKKLEEKYQFLQEQQTQIAKEKAEVELLKRHPDFQEIRATDDFHEQGFLTYKVHTK